MNVFENAFKDQNNEIQSVQYFTDNVMNPCMESTFNFLRNGFSVNLWSSWRYHREIPQSTIIDYLKEVHGKLDGFHNIIHIGGDEVPHDGATVIWESSPICQKFIQEVCYLIFH